MASSGSVPESSPAWFCHECNRETQPLRLPDPHCRHCHSMFVEEISSNGNPDDHPRHWTSTETRIPPDESYDSPPIPSTRQRYEDMEREDELQPPNLPEMLGPILNLFGLQNYVPTGNPDPNAAQGNRSSSSTSNRSAPTRPSEPTNPEASGTNSNGPTRESEPSSEANNNSGGRPASENTENRRPNGGVYTFTFSSDGTPLNANGAQEARPTMIASSLFAHIQAAMGHAYQRQNRAPNTATTNANEPGQAHDDQMPDLVDIDDAPHGHFTDDGDHLHNPGQPPPPGAGGVNLEEGHPLREFLSLISSIAPSNTGFSFGAGGPGGAQFEFTSNGGPGQFGDYVLSEMGMQDVMTHLMNMAGAAMGPQTRPASEAKIRSLRKFKIDPKNLDGDAGECAICKETYVAEEECLELPCKHVFHAQDCIIPWLKQSGTCPVCRFALVDEPSDDPQDVPLDSQGNNNNAAQESGSSNHNNNRSIAELAADAAERRSRNIYGDVPDLELD